MNEEYRKADEWSQTQRDINNRIAGVPRELQAEQLLKWALARLSFYGPQSEPCICSITSFLNRGTVTSI